MIAALLPTRFTRELANGHPHFNAAGKLKTFRHYTNHRVALSVECEGLIHDARLPTETALPQTMTQHHHGSTAGLVFVVIENSTNRCVHAQSCKQIGGNL